MRRGMSMLFLVWTLGTGTCQGQILNTLRSFSDATPGFGGTLGAGFGLTGGNTEVLSLSGRTLVQYVRGRERLRLLGEVTYKSSHGDRIAESSVVHLRHNHRLSPLWHSLAFVQQQRNPFQRLQSRVLAGGGGRFDLVRGTRWRLSEGLSTMLEIENLRDESGSDTSHRMSTFTTLDVTLNEAVSGQVTAFVQPLWRDFHDVRVLAVAGVQAKLAGGLALSVSANVQHDARPPAGVRTTDWDVQTGFVLEL